MVQKPVVYWALLHHDCTTFLRPLLELSHDVGQNELIGVQVPRGLGEARVRAAHLEHSRESIRNRNRPRLLGFARADFLGRDEQGPIVEVHILPLEREQLAQAAQTFERSNDERLQPTRSNSSLARWNNPRVVKFESHVAANAQYFLHDNFARIHGTLRVTPAMAAGIANRASGALKKCRAARQGG